MSNCHVCPVWGGYLLASPLRKLFQNPVTILSPFIREGMTVLDIGCAMGFFSIPMAKMVGSAGRVVCVDLQEKMLEVLMKRARKAGVADRIVPRQCGSESLGLDDLAGTVDFAFASAVVHEVPSPDSLFREAFEALKPGGVFLVIEPSGHVSMAEFEKSVAAAGNAGFHIHDRTRNSRGHSAVLKKV
jgi:ubiquinone/menaquinone biosynthesis C-methylase UbiE